MTYLTGTKEKITVTVYINNFPFETTEQDLIEMFSLYGDVVRVSLATDRQSNRASGYAFVQMRDARHYAGVGISP